MQGNSFSKDKKHIQVHRKIYVSYLGFSCNVFRKLFIMVCQLGLCSKLEVQSSFLARSFTEEFSLFNGELAIFRPPIVK